MKRSILSTAVAITLLGSGLPVTAQVVARYTFDGRAAEGEVNLRPHSLDEPFPGEDYKPDPQKGESGPSLINVGGGVKQGYFRSYYNHGGTKATEGREVLELRATHPHHQDIYQTPEGEGPLPAEGSFTWELVVRIDEFHGTNQRAILVDASRGAGRVVAWTDEGPDKAIVTRLWMQPVQDDTTSFSLRFTIPTDDEKQSVVLSTDLNFEKWYHIAAVYDEESQQARIYVNGEERAKAEVKSANDRGTGFAIAGYGPEVFRIDHRVALDRAFIDAMAFSKKALGPGEWSLKPKQP